MTARVGELAVVGAIVGAVLAIFNHDAYDVPVGALVGAAVGTIQYMTGWSWMWGEHD